MATKVEKFLATYRKLEREIMRYAQGGEREEGQRLSKAINRLYDLNNDPELRDDASANEGRHNAISCLKQAKLAADDAAFAARQAAGAREVSRLTLEARQKAHQDPYGDVGYGDRYRVKGYK